VWDRRWLMGLGLALGAILVAPNAASAGILDASWTAPITNTDGSPLTDLASYRIYYGTSASPCLGGTFSQLASSTPTPPANQTVTYRLTNLTAGTLYSVSLTAVDSTGRESACSTTASAVAQVDFTVTPSTVNFGNANIGSVLDQVFTVQNTRGGTVTGMASVSAPFSIISGSPFTLVGAGATQAVTVRFTPTTTAVASTNVSFTADGDTLSSLVTGTGVSTASLLTVSQAGAGIGTVTSNPTGISCGATCSASFANGTLVSLTAAPAAGSTFNGWSGGCAGTGPCTLTMNAATAVTAAFMQQSFALTVSTAGAGGGTVTSSPAGINCGTTCSTSFTTGTVVTLTAAPAAGSTFTGWSGGGCTGIASCTVTMTTATSVTAAFMQQSFALTVSKSGAGGGTITSSPTGISCGTTCSTSFTTGTPVTLTAAPAAGSTFAGWSGGCAGTGPCTLTMNAPTAVAATFALQTLSPSPPSDTTPPTVAITAPPAGATVTGTVTVTATATDNVGVVGVQFQLDGVSLGAEVATPPYAAAWTTTVTPDGAHVLTAVARDAAGNKATSPGVSVTVANTAPVISGMSLSVTSSGATIGWTTNTPSDTQIEYGLTASYGNLAPLNATLVTVHSQTINGLAANTWYHFRMRSRDAAGNPAVSGDVRFKTRPH
jgi:Bacterial Ig domain/Divergent InlB B-repeat domain/Fibronectin type III domain